MIITGTFWKDDDPKEIVAGCWDSIEEWLKKEYDVHFAPENVSEILNDISRYNNLEKNSENEDGLLRKIEQDITKFRAEFLKKIERFDYHYYGNNHNLDGIPITRRIFVNTPRLYYGSNNNPYKFCFEIGPKISFLLGSPIFYHGYDPTYHKSEHSREKQYIARATDASSIIVYTNGFGNIGAACLKKFYGEIKKKVMRERK
jgi:hypothetical protein